MNDDVTILQVIRTRLLRRGLGQHNEDPVRIIEQYWDMDGTLLFEFDTWSGEVRAPVADKPRAGLQALGLTVEEAGTLLGRNARRVSG